MLKKKSYLKYQSEVFWAYWNSSFALQVWDGTRCPYPTWKVPVETRDLEGEKVLLHQLRNLTVDILVYDNHVQLAKSLKVMHSLVFLILVLWPVFCLELQTMYQFSSAVSFRCSSLSFTVFPIPFYLNAKLLQHV